MVLLVACGDAEIITHTVTKTQNQTVTQAAVLAKTQNQTQTQTQTQTTTLPAITKTRIITVTIQPPTTSIPPVTTTTTTTTTPPPTTTPLPATTTPPPTNGEPAIFTTSDLTLDPDIPAEGAFFKVNVTITNTGGSQGSYEVVLYIYGIDIFDDDAIISTQTFTQSVVLTAGDSTIVTFKKLILPSGYYNLVIDDLKEFLEAGS